MPPRKSIGRPTGATPARSTRASSQISVLTTDSPVTRRSARQAALQSGSQSSEGSRVVTNIHSIRNNAHLPDVYGQQSYAYGANKGLTMPTKLGAEGGRSIHRMAEYLQEDVDLDEEEEEQEAKDLERLRSSDGEGSHVSDLSDVPEESDRENERDEDQSSQTSEPTPFPSSIADHSYNYERGIRRIQPVRVQIHARKPFTPIKKAAQITKDTASGVAVSISQTGRRWASSIRRGTSLMWGKTAETTQSIFQYIRKLPISSLFAVFGVLLAAALAMGMFGATICFFYERIGCTTIPNSGIGTHIHTGFQTICGDCTSVPTTFDFTNTSSQDLSKLSNTLTSINKKITDLERRLTYRIDTNHADLEASLTTLRQQQTALSNHLADHVDSSSSSTSGNVASPLIPKINSFSPANGITIDVHRTSPTKEQQPHHIIKGFRSYFGYAYHSAKPPVMALEPWQDVGDCWCAANLPPASIGKPGQDFVRLAVDTREMVYPTEIVIEHLPAAGNIARSATPREVELWADFSHLDSDAFAQLKLHEKQEDNVLGPKYARLGKMKYDASPGARHVQTAQLDVNRFGEMVYHAQRFVVRVTSNYGGENVCLYRVRLHGLPVGMPEWGDVEGWLEGSGWRAEGDGE